MRTNGLIRFLPSTTLTMIAKGLLLFCLLGLSSATFLKKRHLSVIQPLPSVRTTPLLYRHETVPEVHDYHAQPVVHRVHQPVHVEKYIQPIVHHIYRQPLLRSSVEGTAVHVEPVQPVQPVPIVADTNHFEAQAEAVSHVAV